jgi:DNA-binding transcriptional ArsR family regulator
VQDVCYLERPEQAAVLLKPGRIDILRLLAQPRSCTDVATQLGQAPQKVYYHVKQLQQASLVDLVEERRVRGITEGVYQAAASSYWLSPELVGVLGPRRARDELSLGYLLSLAEELQADLARLAAKSGERPSLGLSGEVRLRPGQRREFFSDLRDALQELLARYGGDDGDPFRIAFACYPREEDSS